MEPMMPENTLAAESDDLRVPVVIETVARRIVLRKLAWMLSTALLVVAVFQAGCIIALASRRPNVIYVAESTLPGPVVVEPGVNHGR